MKAVLFASGVLPFFTECSETLADPNEGSANSVISRLCDIEIVRYNTRRHMRLSRAVSLRQSQLAKSVVLHFECRP